MIETENKGCVVTLDTPLLVWLWTKPSSVRLMQRGQILLPASQLSWSVTGRFSAGQLRDTGGGGSIRDAEGSDLAFQVKASEHAEKALLDKLADVDLAGATAYVTLEPCTKRRRGESCVNLLTARKISVVHIGNCDPNPDVGALAWKTFHQHGVTVRDFPGDLRNEARRDNSAFFSKFQCSTKMYDGGAFDYNSNGGIRRMGPLGVSSRRAGLIAVTDPSMRSIILTTCAWLKTALSSLKLTTRGGRLKTATTRNQSTKVR